MSRPTGFGDVSNPFGEMDLDVEQNATGFNPPTTAAWERPAAPAAPVYTQEDEPFTAADLAAASQSAVPAVTPAVAAPALSFSASVGPGRDVSGRMGPPPPPPAPIPSVSRLSSAPDAALLGGGPPSSSAPVPAEDPSSYPFYSIKRYRKYFNVDTDEVLARLFRAVVLFFRGDFFERLDTNPDLYGPFWIASTLVFVSAAAGNTASYIAYRKATGGGGASAPGTAGEHEAGWYYDVDKVGGSMGLFYGYIGVVGLGFWLVLRWFYKAQVGLAKVWCAYGYALAVYIPMAALCVLPMESVRWSLVGVSTATSGIFLLLNFRSLVVEAAGSQAVPVLMTMLGLHAILGLSLKLVFFHY